MYTLLLFFLISPFMRCFLCHTWSLINPYAGKGKQGAWLMRGCLEESAVKYAQIRAWKADDSLARLLGFSEWVVLMGGWKSWMGWMCWIWWKWWVHGLGGSASDLLCTYLCSYVHICTDHNVHTLAHAHIERKRASILAHTHTLTICVYRFQSNTRASTDKFYLQTFHLICKRVAAPQKYPLSTFQQLAHTHTLSKPDSCKCACVCAHTHKCVRECGCADVNASHNVFFSRATENKAFGCPICGSPFKKSKKYVLIFTTINI